MSERNRTVFTLPNFLSLLRLALIPIYVSLYKTAETPGQFFMAGGILMISCLTDLADGFLARKFRMVSTLGIVLDPVADKATQLTLAACLSARYPPLLPVLLLLIVKETFQLFAGLFFLRRGRMLSGALPEGKRSTAVLFTSLIVLVLFPGLPADAVSLLSGINLIFLSLSFFGYIREYGSFSRRGT